MAGTDAVQHDQAGPGRAELERLFEALRGAGSAVVAFSGGVDSSVVLAAATTALGAERVVAVTATSVTMIDPELEAARNCAAALGVRHAVIETDELDDEDYAANTTERCYFCRRHLTAALNELAREEGFASVLDGATSDDLRDHRPGLRAAEEAGVRHPLIEAGLGKDAVRRVARELGLVVWDKPANACLATRIPYGEPITPAALRQVAEAEEVLRRLGFRQCRVRHHGTVARVEVEPADLARAVGATMRSRIVEGLRTTGFVYVALDLSGFRSGSMNEAAAIDGGDDWSVPDEDG